MSRIYEALQQTSRPEEIGTSVTATIAKELDNPDWNFESLVAIEPAPANHQLHVLTAAHSFITEQFRTLQIRLQHIREQRSLKTLLVSSSLAEEGKSFVAFNLARSLSQHGKQKVLLLEGDLRRPAQCAHLGVAPLAGFGEWSRSTDGISRFVYRISGCDIFLLPAGNDVRQPVETLASQRTLDLINEISGVFDWVIVDSAPLVPLADTAVLSRICDGTLVVVRRAKAMKSALVQGLECVETGKLIGFILNDFPGHYDYDYPKYYSKSRERGPVQDSRSSSQPEKQF
jgi:protein-tyrosine kinase